MSVDDLQVTPLGPHHDRAAFTCGEATLDRYLHEQASQDRKRSLARCYVLTRASEPARIVGYYTLSAHSLRLHDLPEDAARGIPYRDVPGVLIGRLALDVREQGRGLGERLLAAAVEHCARLESELGLRVIVVDALSEGAARFYERFGFQRFGSGELRLFLSLRHVRPRT